MATLTRLAALALIAAPGAAMAHTGIGSVHGFSAGLLHPLGGFDPVLAMVAIGLWAGASGGAMRWALPTAFLAGMASGVPILDTITNPCRVTQVGRNTFRIVLTQGLNRQIRRMCEHFGYTVRIGGGFRLGQRV